MNDLIKLVITYDLYTFTHWIPELFVFMISRPNDKQTRGQESFDFLCNSK